MDLDLRPLEQRILGLLLESAGRVVTRQAIVDELWGPEGDVDVRAVDASVSRIRKALNGRGDAIVTVRRVGYRLDAEKLA